MVKYKVEDRERYREGKGTSMQNEWQGINTLEKNQREREKSK